MNRNTKGAVRLIFDKLERQMGAYDFQVLFNTILTDYTEFGIIQTAARNSVILMR